MNCDDGMSEDDKRREAEKAARIARIRQAYGDMLLTELSFRDEAEEALREAEAPPPSPTDGH
jgi:hypothetical protein